MSHFVCAAILKFKDFFYKNWYLYIFFLWILNLIYKSCWDPNNALHFKGERILGSWLFIDYFFHWLVHSLFQSQKEHFPEWFSDIDKNDFYWLDFLSQLLPYVLTSFTWCGTWGAPLALIQLGLGWWSVSMVSVLGVAWWGVYQQGWLSICMLFWFAESFLQYVLYAHVLVSLQLFLVFGFLLTTFFID